MIRVLSLSLSLSALAPLAAQAAPASSETAPATVRLADLLDHYARVERELREAPLPADPALRAARLCVLDHLRDYRERGIFGVNTDFPGERQPYFVDDAGRRCAVAHLLDCTGHGDLTLRVAAAANHAWIADLAGDRELGAWLAAHGLSLADAARIQGPPPMPPLPPPPVEPLSFEPPPRRDAPEDAAPPAATPTRGTPAAGAPRRGSPAAAMPAARQPRGTPLVDLDAETWLPWFELQSSRWFAARALPAAPANTTRSDPWRGRALERCRTALGDPDEAIRAAAALAVGRLGAADAGLRALLADRAWAVRCTAVVGLAEAGSAAAFHALLALANEPGPLQPLALAALGGSGRRDALADRLAAGILAASHDPELLAGAAAYARLLGGDPAARARDRAGSDDNTTVRALLALAIGEQADAATVASLSRAVSGNGLPSRRAAAAALGRTADPLAMSVLRTAFELEHELGARTQLLLAIGEHGDAAARAFLLEQMQRGRKPLRGWAAVALGLWGRGRGDAALAEAVREGHTGERNRDAEALWLLALGLLQDAAATELLARACGEGESSTTRTAAVYALGLGGDPAAQPALVKALRSDDCPVVRATAADVLAVVAGAAAIPHLTATVADDRDVEVRAAAAFALGATADESACAALLALADDAAPAVRAAAVAALGRLLDVDPQHRFARLGWRSDYAHLPATFGWLARLDR